MCYSHCITCIQLSTFCCRFSARTLLQFMTDERLKAKVGTGISGIYPPWSRFIVSCSSDQTLADAGSRGASSRLENIGAHFVTLPKLTFDVTSSDDEAQCKAVGFIAHVLKHQRRRLQPFQLEHIRRQVSTISLNSLRDNPLHDLPPSSPSYVNVLALQARHINNLNMKPFPDIIRYEKGFFFVCDVVLMLSAVGAPVSVDCSVIACSTLRKRILGPNS